MQRWKNSLLAVTMLTIAVSGIHVTPVSAATSATAFSKTHAKQHLNLKLNVSDEALDWMTREEIARGNKAVFKNGRLADKKTLGKLELTFDTTTTGQVDYDLISGHGTGKIGGVQATVDFSGDITKFTTSSGKVIYSGPVEATYKVGNQTYNGLIGLSYDPSNGNALVSLSVGEISDKGTGMVFFGEPFMEMAEVRQLMLKKLKGNPVTVDQTPAPEQLEQPAITLAGEGATALLDDGSFNYRGSADNMYLRFSAETTPGYVGKSIVGLNVYDRDPATNGPGGGSVQVRAWSNSQAVINYVNAKDPYHFNTSAYVYNGYISLTTPSTQKINIINAGPVDGTTISKWDFLANVPLIGNALDFLANSYVYLYNNNLSITSTKQINSSLATTYYWRKKISTLGKSADFPYMSDTAYARRAQKEGGATAIFYYDEYTGGTQPLSAGARMDYMVDSGNLYLGYFYSDAAVVNWNGTF